MRSETQARESRALVEAGVQAADGKLGEEIVVLDVGEQLGVVEYFVIASGRNTRQVATIAEEIEEATKHRCGRGPLRIEGLREATWVLLDYGDVIFHLFLDETRTYYDLEHLWSAAPRVGLEGLLGAALDSNS